MANQTVGLRSTQDLTNGQVEQVPEQHPADHGVRNDEYPSSTEIGDVTDALFCSTVGVRIAFALGIAPVI